MSTTKKKKIENDIRNDLATFEVTESVFILTNTVFVIIAMIAYN